MSLFLRLGFFFSCRKENTCSCLKVDLEIVKFWVVSGKWEGDNCTYGLKIVHKGQK